MGVTSYSQVGEDLQIAFFLGDPRNRTYIDVGCLWPIQHSNSFFFYERGGHGLCIDPNGSVAQDWSATRPRDIFLNAAIAGEAGTMTYIEHENPVFNTLSADRAVMVAKKAATHRGRGATGTRDVEVMTLDSAIAQTDFAARCENGLDFLSIDVEGLEEAVINGFSFEPLRPKVVVCEYIRGYASGQPVEETPMTAMMRERGYGIGGYTGHDVYYVDGHS